MRSKYLLDTNTISEPLRPEPNREILRKIAKHEAEIALAAPVWHELLYGLELLPPSKKREKIEKYLMKVVQPSFPLLPYDRAAAEWQARERARLRSLGTPRPFADSQIAAIAASNGLVLVTRNRKDFDAFEDLLIEEWGARDAAAQPR